VAVVALVPQEELQDGMEQKLALLTTVLLEAVA
jgi:hypothetical protein